MLVLNPHSGGPSTRPLLARRAAGLTPLSSLHSRKPARNGGQRAAKRPRRTPKARHALANSNRNPATRMRQPTLTHGSRHSRGSPTATRRRGEASCARACIGHTQRTCLCTGAPAVDVNVGAMRDGKHVSYEGQVARNAFTPHEPPQPTHRHDTLGLPVAGQYQATLPINDSVDLELRGHKRHHVRRRPPDGLCDLRKVGPHRALGSVTANDKYEGAASVARLVQLARGATRCRSHNRVLAVGIGRPT